MNLFLVKGIKSKYIIIIIIFLGFANSISNSNKNLNKFDKNFVNTKNEVIHRMIKSDIFSIRNSANDYLDDWNSNLSFFESGSEYTRTYLSPLIIAIYYKFINENIFTKSTELLDGEIVYSDKIVKLDNHKEGILYFQCFIYFFSLLTLFNKFKNKFNNIALLFIIFYLSFEPTITQWNSSFWTESIYLSLTLIFLSKTLFLPKKNSKYLFIGTLLGLMYMQKTVSIFLIFILIAHIFINLKNNRILKIVNLTLAYLVVLLFLGIHNLHKDGSFYIMPEQSKVAHYHYISHKLVADKKNISESEAYKIKINNEKRWIKINNINISKISDKRKLYDFKQKYFLKAATENPLELIKIYIWKTLQSGILDYSYVSNDFNFDKSIKNYWKKETFRSNLKKRIIYSLIFYFFCIYGIIIFIKDKKFSLILYLSLIISYFLFMLGWMGHSRYFITNLTILSLFFGVGVGEIINKTLLRINS